MQLLMDQKQGCLRQLRELRPLDRRMNELLCLEKRQSKELDDFKGLLADAHATLDRLRVQRTAKARELALTRKELARLYSQLPAASETLGQDVDGVLQDPYTELYDLAILDCTTDQGSHHAVPSIKLADFTSSRRSEDAATPCGGPPGQARGPRDVLLADAAVLGFDAILPKASQRRPPLDDATVTACLEAAQRAAPATAAATQQQSAHTPLASRPFRLAKSRSAPYRAEEGEENDA